MVVKLLIFQVCKMGITIIIKIFKLDLGVLYAAVD